MRLYFSGAGAGQSLISDIAASNPRASAVGASQLKLR